MFWQIQKTAGSMWQSIPEHTLSLQLLSSPNPTLELIRTHKNVLYRFVTLLYGFYEEDITTVDAARFYLFQHKCSDFEHMPPCSDALHQHFLRGAYCMGYYTQQISRSSATNELGIAETLACL